MSVHREGVLYANVVTRRTRTYKASDTISYKVQIRGPRRQCLSVEVLGSGVHNWFCIYSNALAHTIQQRSITRVDCHSVEFAGESRRKSKDKMTQ